MSESTFNEVVKAALKTYAKAHKENPSDPDAWIRQFATTLKVHVLDECASLLENAECTCGAARRLGILSPEMRGSE